MEDLDISEEPMTGFDYILYDDRLKQGAEARIHECVFLGRPAVVKERFKKSYRHALLDAKLNKARTKAELKGIVRAKEVGVQSPAVFFVDGEANKIIMERVDGITAKEWIEQQRGTDDFKTSIENLGKVLGNGIGKLHSGSLIHGDLTTSNVILKKGDPNMPVFIDFGLSSQGKVTPEEKGVDLYVLERAITSTHFDSAELMKGVLEGYSEAGAKQATAVVKKLDEIRMRGRKRDMIG